MKIDRNIQRRILEILRDAFPGPTDDALDEILNLAEQRIVEANLLYLDGHGLIESGMFTDTAGDYYHNTAKFKITHNGLDFLQSDGGLSAILGVVTIRLHDDTIKTLIEAKILQSDLPPQDKKRWIDQLRELPAETTKHLVLKLVDKGLETGPAALAAIGSLLARVSG